MNEVFLLVRELHRIQDLQKQLLLFHAYHQALPITPGGEHLSVGTHSIAR